MVSFELPGMVRASYDSYTVDPVLGDHPFCPAKAVAQDRTKIMFYLCVHFTHSQAVRTDAPFSSYKRCV